MTACMHTRTHTLSHTRTYARTHTQARSHLYADTLAHTRRLAHTSISLFAIVVRFDVTRYAVWLCAVAKAKGEASVQTARIDAENRSVLSQVYRAHIVKPCLCAFM